jgi:glycosyltransferase involved in cell wall biosynthesis
MKAIFVHDHRFCVSADGKVFTPGQLPYSVWQRYLEVFDELSVVGRSSPVSFIELKKLNLSSGDCVSFAFAPDLGKVSNYFTMRGKAKALLYREISKSDAVIIRTSMLGGLAAKIAGELKKPWAIEVVGCPWDACWNHGTVKGKIYAPWAFWGQKRLLAKASRAIYVSSEFLQRRYPCRGTTAGVSNVMLPSLEPHVMQLRSDTIRASRDRIVFGLIGSLETRYKGIQTAIAAMSRIRANLPAFEFRVLGGGDSGPWTRLAQKYRLDDLVRFCGTLPGGDAVFKWLDDVDVYLQPSFQEGLPRALVEAMSRGCPAIGSTAGGIPELLDDDCLITPGDHRALAEKILHACGSKEWRLQKAERNWRKAGEYTKKLLDARRSAFWQQFADDVRAQKTQKRGNT